MHRSLYLLACLSLATLMAVALTSCGAKEVSGQPSSQQATPADGALTQAVFSETHSTYQEYWHAGLAEISRFELRQTRYGEIREGDLVMVFVTEPFLPEAQVKHELSDQLDDIPVLKLNAMRTFTTGIYPYSIMTSSFVPTDGTPGIKVTSSVTEWCGQAFAQLNRRDDGVHAELRSYFQDEGDTNEVLTDVAYEDALWQELRRDPSALPVGALELIPALHALRLYHNDLRAYNATATLGSHERAGVQLKRYEIQYEGLERNVKIDFESEFPYAIVAFEETHSGELTTAVRTHAIMDAYWSHNGVRHEGLRHALGLIE